MATTNGGLDTTMLILFCGSHYYVIDDINKCDVYAGPSRITDTWPELQHIQVAPGGTATGTFASDLDAVYYEVSSRKLVFFKGASCTVADYSSGQKPTWDSGLITEFYQFSEHPYTVSFTADIDGAVVGLGWVLQLYLYKEGDYTSGTSRPPRKGSPMSMDNAGTLAQAGWDNLLQGDSIVAAEYVYPPERPRESALFTAHKKNSQSVDDYAIMFFRSRQQNAPLNKLWPHFNGAPVDAAVRLDPSFCGC
jgi:hypothetical protein